MSSIETIKEFKLNTEPYMSKYSEYKKNNEELKPNKISDLLDYHEKQLKILKYLNIFFFLRT